MADDKRNYRTEIPNIIDDLGLDPHERALYCHYKRACGGSDCEWVESVRLTAQRTKMSFGRASEARKSLFERGLIRLVSKGNDGTAVRVVDIWELNTIFYSQEYRPAVDGWSIEQLKEWCQGVHNMNTIKEGVVHGEQVNGTGVHNANASVHNMNNKKEPLKNITPNGVGEKTPSDVSGEEKPKGNGPRSKLMTEFITLTGIDLPKDKPSERYWWSKIGVLYSVAQNDVEIAKKLINDAFNELGGEKVYDPGSLVKTARKLMSTKTHKPKIGATAK